MPSTPSSKSRMIRIPARALKIHPVAQRKMVPATLKRLIAEMDLDAVGVIHAVEYPRDGVRGIWVIDGQTRVTALCKLDLGEWSVEVKIHEDVLTDERACALFLKLNHRAAVNPYSRFLAAVIAGDSVARGVDAIIRKVGLRLTSGGSADGTFSSVTTSEKAYRLDDGLSYEWALRTAINAWGKISFEGPIIGGLAKFHSKHGASVVPSFVKKLAKRPGGPTQILADAKQLQRMMNGAMDSHIVDLLIKTHDAGRPDKLIPARE